MAAKTKSTVRKARKAKAPKRKAKAKRATRRAAKKARRARKPKAPKRRARATKRRARKAKKASKVAKRKARKAKVAKKPKKPTKKSQTGSYRQVWNGTKTWTRGGLTKKDLKLNKRRRVVSRRRKATPAGMAACAKWRTSVMKARAELGITGFMKINRGEMGIKLYNLAKSY